MYCTQNKKARCITIPQNQRNTHIYIYLYQTQVALWEAVAAGSYHRYCPPAAKLLTETYVRCFFKK